jgi:hypothetical protein
MYLRFLGLLSSIFASVADAPRRARELIRASIALRVQLLYATPAKKAEASGSFEMELGAKQSADDGSTSSGIARLPPTAAASGSDCFGQRRGLALQAARPHGLPK